MLTAAKDQPGPPIRFFSVTQNDNGLMCQDKEELAIVAENGGAVIAPMLRATNRIARALADEFPDVLFDTFACTRSSPIAASARRLTKQRCADANTLQAPTKMVPEDK